MAESDCFSFWGQSLNVDYQQENRLVYESESKGNWKEKVSASQFGEMTHLKFQEWESNLLLPRILRPSVVHLIGQSYSVSLGTVEPTIQSLTVYLVYLPNTTGNVFFDDVSLEFN